MQKQYRLPKYNYASNGHYFITICTKNRKPIFGKIIDNKMKLSELGEIAKQYWLNIPHHVPYAKLDEFTISPDHVHGIIAINKPQPESLSIIIRTYKGAVTTWARLNYNMSDIWQSRFHDSIIFDEISLNNVRNYIKNHPLSP